MLRGPSGCGKDTLIRYMAKKFRFQVITDRDVETELENTKLVLQEETLNSVYDTKQAEGISTAKVFCEVFDRVQFERMARKKFLYYLREIPNMTNEKEREVVRATLARVVKKCPLDIVPVIFNLNSNIYE